MYSIERMHPTGPVARYNQEFEHFQIAQSAALTWCLKHPDTPHRILNDGTVITPWFGTIEPGTRPDDAKHTDIQQNELLTYMQCGTTRLQQLVDLFGEMVRDKSGDPAMRIQRIDALADIIKNQLQELQTIATPQGGAR